MKLTIIYKGCIQTMKTIKQNFLELSKPYMISVLLSGVFLLAACSGGENLSPTLDNQPTIVEPEAQPVNDETKPTEEPKSTTARTAVQTSPASPEPLPTEAGIQESSLDACLLLTQDEAAAALGKSVGESIQEIYPPIFSCSYASEDLDQVTIIVVEYASADEAAASFQMELDINTYEEVPGIGERALRPIPIMDLSALMRNYEVSIDLATGDSEAEYLLARDLMEKALSRLP